MPIKIKFDFDFNETEMLILNEHYGNMFSYVNGIFTAIIPDEVTEHYTYENINDYLNSVKDTIIEHPTYPIYHSRIRKEKLKKLINKK